jgi:hypothetical protein
MLIARIQKDLFDFIDQDPEDLGGLLEFWYQANSPALSAALTAQPGLNLIVNVSSFKAFERLSKKLFLVADTLVLRDTRKWTSDETGNRAIPIPTSNYKPGYYDDIIGQLQKIRPSPLSHFYRPNLYWSSTTKTLNNGYHVAYASWDYNSIPEEFVKWIAGPGRNYMKTGSILYAPFIPPIEMEKEFLKNDVNLPEYFSSQPCFHQRYDWLSDDKLNALLSVKVPFLDRIDIDTISKIKDDYRDEFTTFSRTLLNSIDGIKASFGTSGFISEIRNIQRNQIDAGLSDLERTARRIASIGALRRVGIIVGLAGLSAATFLGAPVTAIVSGLAATGVAMVMDKVAQLKEQGDLRDKSPYFLWRLRQAAR